MKGRTFYEFFCGGGLARLGLGDGWDCLFANDIDAAKCAAYRANFPPAAELREGDVHALNAADLPGRADLAWASFPCQDLSLAGARGGLSAPRSGAFHGFWRLIEALGAEGRAPRAIVIENVSGLASSAAGRDLAVVLTALARAGYRFDARIIDAADFLPQSRPRLFVIGWTGDQAVGERGAPEAALAAAFGHLDPAARAAFHRLPLPAPTRRNLTLGAIVGDADWFPDDQTAALIAMMTPRQRARLDAALADADATGGPVYGAAFRRMRGGVQRLEARWDVAGCLRTPAGGSSRQILLAALPGGQVRARRLTGREALRLMGAPESYVAPKSETQALKLAGDGVAVPVARHIAAHALEPLLSPLLTGALEPAAAAE